MSEFIEHPFFKMNSLYQGDFRVISAGKYYIPFILIAKKYHKDFNFVPWINIKIIKRVFVFYRKKSKKSFIASPLLDTRILKRS